MFVHPVNVRYFEVDQQGVVFNMWYLAYFDDAMTAYLGHVGHSYKSLIARGLDVQLVRTEVDWKGAVTFGDDVGIEVSTHAIGNTSFTLSFRVLRAGEPVVQARTVYVVVATDRSGKRPIPDDLRASLAP
ncbi:MAG: acyl-CoA thioesterase [Polyangiales bacterium]